MKSAMKKSVEMSDGANRDLVEKHLLLGASGPRAAELTKGKYYADEASACLVSDRKMRTTEAYDNLMGFERPVGIFFYMLFVILCPLIFRYAMLASTFPQKDDISNKFYVPVGNATITMSSTWAIEPCVDVKGITLTNIKINVANVTSPNMRAGFPSIALFASQDLKTWYNFYKPVKTSDAFISNWQENVFNVNQTKGTACLGSIYSNYLVACMNVFNLAYNLKKGETIKGPPFNDRCFQVQSLCGIPGVQPDPKNVPPKCVDSSVDPMLLVRNTTKPPTPGTDGTTWGGGLTFWDWIVLITIFLDTMGNFMRFLPLLCGRPTDLESAKSVQCSGTAVIGCSTPIVSENEAIFLRGLVGRTLTALHTIGSRHNIKGLYVDTIINEFRGKTEDKRTQMWCAWIQFCEVIADMKTRSMSWEHNLSNIKLQDIANRTGLVHDSGRLGTILRTVRIRKDCSVQWDCGLGNVKFEGISVTRDSSYDSAALFELESPKEPVSRSKSLDSRYQDEEPELDSLNQCLSKAAARVELNFEDILPLICFLDGWLEEIKYKDPIYNYKDKTEALKGIFNDAPCQKYFFGDQLLEVQERLLLLFDIFNGDKVQPVPEDIFTNFKKSPMSLPLYRDEYLETMWTVTRIGLPDWQIAWGYLSRSRLKKQDPDDMDEDNLVLESTRIKSGTIVYLNVPDDVSRLHQFDRWFATRQETYKVLQVRRDLHGKTLKLVPWPLVGDLEDQKDLLAKGIINRPMESVSLIEQNRGKAGALNVYADFLRLRAKKWTSANDIPYPIQTIAAIVDARHMLAEPAIFVTESLPFFARRDRGNAHGKALDTLLVQYPQFFSNVGQDDYLDNKNSGYYTIWQTLRDCAKSITSSGTNAVWDITNPNFSFATSSRIEDTGTSQKYLADYLFVHVSCFVAYGIAKDTEDYIEAVYRWSTGAVELFWATLFSNQFKHFLVVGTIVGIFAFSCFSEYFWAYFTWLGLLFVIGAVAYYEKATGLRPVRILNVSTTIVMNTMYWISNLSSLVWVVLVPVRIAIFSSAPISTTPEQSLYWAFVSLILRFPIGIVIDRIITMSTFLSPKTKKDKWNFSLVLWRSSQLYVCSFAYTLLSLSTGTQTAWRAFRQDGDNTMWSSFRVSNDEIGKARQNMAKMKSCCSIEYLQSAYIYIRLEVLKFTISLTLPDVITTYLAALLFLVQILCIFYSIAISNAQNGSYILTTIIVCGLNIFLVSDIALLLMPALSNWIGRPPRLEYVFAILSTIIIISLLMTHSLHNIVYYLSIV